MLAGKDPTVYTGIYRGHPEFAQGIVGFVNYMGRRLPFGGEVRRYDARSSQRVPCDQRESRTFGLMKGR